MRSGPQGAACQGCGVPVGSVVPVGDGLRQRAEASRRPPLSVMRSWTGPSASVTGRRVGGQRRVNSIA